MLLKNKLSSVYHTLISPEVLNIEIPEERYADCNNCHHCVSKQDAFVNTKCCTYYPVIPNYMIGALLSTDNPLLEEGRKRMRHLVAQKKGVTPYGIIPTLQHDVLYQNSIAKKNTHVDKQTAESLLCPFYNNGTCSIWSHRTELCSTFFCMSSGGDVGKIFWTTFQKYFTAIEFKLSIHAMQQLHYPVNMIRIKPLNPQNLKLDTLDCQLNAELYGKIWQSWKGKEIEWYLDCYSVIQKMNATNTMQLLGIEEQLLEQKIKSKAQKFIENQIPNHLLWVEDQTNVEQVGDTIVLNSKIKLSKIEYLFLRQFDGKKSTYDLLRKSQLMRINISNNVSALIRNKVLYPIKN